MNLMNTFYKRCNIKCHRFKHPIKQTFASTGNELDFVTEARAKVYKIIVVNFVQHKF